MPVQFVVQFFNPPSFLPPSPLSATKKPEEPHLVSYSAGGALEWRWSGAARAHSEIAGQDSFAGGSVWRAEKSNSAPYAAEASRRERMALVTLDPRLVFICVSSG